MCREPVLAALWRGVFAGDQSLFPQLNLQKYAQFTASTYNNGWTGSF